VLLFYSVQDCGFFYICIVAGEVFRAGELHAVHVHQRAGVRHGGHTPDQHAARTREKIRKPEEEVHIQRLR
jgi:hypothetical protein